MIDGSTQGQAFRKVIIPLAAPGVFTRSSPAPRAATSRSARSWRRA
jgi:hypothetical protein